MTTKHCKVNLLTATVGEDLSKYYLDRYLTTKFIINFALVDAMYHIFLKNICYIKLLNGNISTMNDFTQRTLNVGTTSTQHRPKIMDVVLIIVCHRPNITCSLGSDLHFNAIPKQYVLLL